MCILVNINEQEIEQNDKNRRVHQKSSRASKKELSGNVISDCSITMNLEAKAATENLSLALLAQAEANQANSEAIANLAEKLKVVDACAIKIVENDLKPLNF